MTYGAWNSTGSCTFTDQTKLWSLTLSSTLYAIPPIGTILPWGKFINAGVTGSLTLPSGWLECSGQTVNDTDSPYHGVTLPDVNLSPKFLRGNNTPLGSGGSDTHNHSVSTSGGGTINALNGTVVLRISTPTHSHSVGNTENIPPYYNVVFIIRVK